MEKQMPRKIRQRLGRQQWIWAIGSILFLLNLYSFSPSYGQSATPTPHIGTVPNFTLTPTPTTEATALPSATPIPVVPTATQVSSGNNGNGNNGNGNNGNGNNGGAVPLPAAPNLPGVQTQSEITLTAIVTATTLNMYRGPSPSERVIDTLFLNDEVQLLARNGDGSWLLICCGNRTQQPGWVNAAFLRTLFERSQLLQLVPVAPGFSSSSSAALLQLQMTASPAQVWQGLEMEIHLIVTNPGNRPVRNVNLRDHLPAALKLQEVTGDLNAVIKAQRADGGGTIVSANWSQLAAGEEVRVTLIVQVDADLENGALIDNLAIVTSNDGSSVTAGTTLAMPPSLLPIFR